MLGFSKIANRDYGIELAQRGFATFSADQYVFGETICGRTEEEISADFYNQYPKWSIGARRILDQIRALDVLDQLPYIRKKMLISLSVRNVVWKRGMIPQVIKSGIPLGITQILMAFSIAFTNIMGKWLLQGTGESFIAGYGVAVKIMVMVQYLIITYMIGYQAVAAYSYGAKNRARFWEAYRHTRKVVLFAGISAAVLFSLLSWPLVRLFTADPQITQYAVAMMISMAASLAISFPLPPVITAYQATGKGGAGALISSLRQGIVYIPLVLTLPRLLSVWGFYILQPVSDMLSIAIALLVFRQSRKKLDAELAVPPE
jgi:Na+-driven multidrug efflux pump